MFVCWAYAWLMNENHCLASGTKPINLTFMKRTNNNTNKKAY